MTVEAIQREMLNEFKTAENALAAFRKYAGAEYRKFWKQDVELYRECVDRLIKVDQIGTAFDLIQQGLEDHPGDPVLQYRRILALARVGNTHQAFQSLEQLKLHPQIEDHLLVLMLSLEARLYKDLFERCRDPAKQLEYCRESARLYNEAHQLSNWSYPGLNAATMSFLAGDVDIAREIAQEVIQQVGQEVAEQDSGENYWADATRAEASLILGDVASAETSYRAALQAGAANLGDVASISRNFRLLAQRIEVGPSVRELLNLGAVVVFAGHMIDDPRRAASGQDMRFPASAALERGVRDAIAEALDEIRPRVGYSSVAAGSDILFAEQILKRKLELHVVLPFALDDFIQTSVAPRSKDHALWKRRCETVLEKATEVHFAAGEPYLGDPKLFAYANSYLQGLAVNRAQRLGLEALALAVLEPDADAQVGGTAYFVRSWTAANRPARTIDLAKIRSGISRLRVSSVSTDAEPAEDSAIQETRRRAVKTMLFADVKNFSKLSEEAAPSFFVEFLNQVTQLIDASTAKPQFSNTWGDGLFLVFDNVTDGADFALRLLERVAEFDWPTVGLPADTTVRIGLHTGPVYKAWDPVIQRDNFFGGHVNRAARIEPVTVPGCAFASEQFAALLAVDPEHDFVCEQVGVADLAKGYDRCTLYQLRRR